MKWWINMNLLNPFGLRNLFSKCVHFHIHLSTIPDEFADWVPLVKLTHTLFFRKKGAYSLDVLELESAGTCSGWDVIWEWQLVTQDHAQDTNSRGTCHHCVLNGDWKVTVWTTFTWDEQQLCLVEVELQVVSCHPFGDIRQAVWYAWLYLCVGRRERQEQLGIVRITVVREPMTANDGSQRCSVDRKQHEAKHRSLRNPCSHVAWLWQLSSPGYLVRAVGQVRCHQGECRSGDSHLF